MGKGRHGSGLGPAEVIVIGAGLVGLAASTFLARQGRSVLVLEAYEDPRKSQHESSHSIGLTLSARGLRALDALSLGPQLAPWLVPVIGRCVHRRSGVADTQRYALVGDGAIYSVKRSALLRVLCEAAERAGVDLQFRCRCQALDADRKRAIVREHDIGETAVDYDCLICADGARSGIRTDLVRRYGVRERAEVLHNAFKEIDIRAAVAGGLERNALHVWPRGEHLLIALPNCDGSFSATVFVPTDSQTLQRMTSRQQVHAFLENTFEDMPDLDVHSELEFLARPVGHMRTVECARWSYPNSVLVVGDAAHAMPPFFGQGVNCAFEGCLALAEMSRGFAGNWDELFNEFERLRRPHVAAIWRLSHANQENLSRRVAESDYLVRRHIETALQRRFPETFLPLYAMIAFSTLPYAEAYARAMQQESVVERIAAKLTNLSELDSHMNEGLCADFAPLPAAAGDYRPQWLPAVVTSFDGSLGERRRYERA